MIFVEDHSVPDTARGGREEWKSMTRNAARILLPLFAMLATIAGLAIASATRAADAWLPLERVELFRVLTVGMNIDPTALEAVEACLAESKADPASGDDLTFVRNAALPFVIIMVGKGDRVHSMILSVPIEPFLEEADNVAIIGLSHYFQAIYPDWPGAADWPEQSAKTVLSKFPYNRKAPRNDPEGAVAQVSRNGITSATLAAIFVMNYSVTVREQPVESQATETHCD
jgi:hypothetical protein